MDIFSKIAEEKIREAIERGELNGLPGAGKPLCLDEDDGVPEDRRMAYKILKNAGCIPPELEIKKEIEALRSAIKGTEDENERAEKLKELNYKLMKFSMMMKRPLNIEPFPEYEEKVLEKILK